MKLLVRSSFKLPKSRCAYHRGQIRRHRSYQRLRDRTTSGADTIVCFAGSVLANKGIGTVSRFSKLESAMTY